MSLAEGPGFRSFVNLLCGVVGSDAKWQPPGHGEQGYVLRKEHARLEADARESLKLLRRERLTVHFDCWSDRWQRVFVLAVVYWLEEGASKWTFRRVAFAFERTATFSSEDAGSQHAAAPCATAVRAAWRTAGFGELPFWACADNCNTALSSVKLLGLTSKRCFVHVLGIPVQRLLFDSKKRRGSKFATEAPREHPAPQYFLVFEMLRAVAYRLADADVQQVFLQEKKEAQKMKEKSKSFLRSTLPLNGAPRRTWPVTP
jgi:hypothetical protein